MKQSEIIEMYYNLYQIDLPAIHDFLFFRNSLRLPHRFFKNRFKNTFQAQATKQMRSILRRMEERISRCCVRYIYTTNFCCLSDIILFVKNKY